MAIFHPLIPANAGTQIVWNNAFETELIGAEPNCIALYDLGPGIRRDERDLML